MATPDYIEETEKGHIRSWILSEMLRGAWYGTAAILFFVILFLVFYGIGLLLPEASRDTPQPMFYGSVLTAPASLNG